MATADDYTVLELIGSGAFGQIRKVRRKADGEILCRKEITYMKMSQKEKEQLTAEFAILGQLKHPNIVQYMHRDHIKQDSTLHLYMEYCGNGDLAKVIRRNREKGIFISESVVWMIFCQLVLALYRCHNGVNPPDLEEAWSTMSTKPVIPPGTTPIRVLHRDLKPENVFLGTENEVKLGDFGLSKQLGPEQHLATTFLGSPSYMSPELITDKPYTLKSDIWSLGCIMYELCALNVPFPARDQVQLFSKIKSGRYSPIPSQYSPELRQVIDMCLQMDPYRRPDTAALLEHHMFRIARREREVIQLTRAVKLREEKTRRHEQMLLVKQDEILKEWETRNIQMYSKIDEELKAQWEIRAHAEIRRQVDVEIQTRLKAEVEQQVQFEVERRIRELDLVPRASNHASLNGSGSSGASSSMDSVPPPYTSQLQTPYLKRIQQTSIPDSPADITMRSPSLNGTPGNQRSPIVDMHTVGEMLPPAPVTPSRTNGGNLGGYFEQMEESPTPPTFQKQPTFVSAGPIKKTLGTNRMGLQRAGTTGLLFPKGAHQTKADYGLGGTGQSHDDVATVGAHTAESRPRALSILQIQRMRGKSGSGTPVMSTPAMGTPAKWDKEHADAPSPFLKRERAFR